MSSYRRLTAAREIEEPTINLTPLIDVVFVVLIMFIVIAPILEKDRVELASAGQQDSIRSITPDQTRSPIQIHVKADDTIWINKERVLHVKLTPYIKQLKAKYPRCTPLIFHDRQAHFGTYQKLKNALEEAGFSDMDIALNP